MLLRPLRLTREKEKRQGDKREWNDRGSDRDKGEQVVKMKEQETRQGVVLHGKDMNEGIWPEVTYDPLQRRTRTGEGDRSQGSVAKTADLKENSFLDMTMRIPVASLASKLAV